MADNILQKDETLAFNQVPAQGQVPSAFSGESLVFTEIQPNYIQGGEVTPEQEYEFPLIDSIKKAADSRRQEVHDAWIDFREGKQSLEATLTQTAGKGVVGLATDVAGFAAMEAGTSLYALLPQTVRKEIGEYAGQAWNWAENDPSAQAAMHFAQEGAEVYNEWKQDNPQDARTFESVVNIGSILLPKRPKAPLDPDNLPFFMRGPQVLEAAIAADKKELAVNLLTPSKLSTEAIQEGRVTENIFRTRKEQLSRYDAEVADRISKLGINPNYSTLRNSNIIQNEIGKEADNLAAFLKDIVIDSDALTTNLNAAVRDIKNNILITSDKNLENVVNQMAGKLNELLKNTDGSASSVLQVRKDFDNWVKSQVGSGAFGEKVTAISTATKYFRNSLNDTIKDQANRQVPLNKLGFVDDSLEKQAAYYRALEVLAPKIQQESKYAVGRLFQTIKQITGVAIPTTLLGSLGLYGYYAQLSLNSLLPVAVGSVGLAALSGVKGHTMKRALGSTLTLANKAIEQTQDPVVRNILKADRAVVIGLLQNTETIKEEANKE